MVDGTLSGVDMADDLLSERHVGVLIDYLHAATGVLVARYARNHIVLAANPAFCGSRAPDLVVGESIHRFLVDPDGRDCGLLSAEPAELPITFTARLRDADITVECRLYPDEKGYLLIGERLAATESEALERLSLMTNELGTLTIELRKRNAALEQANETIRELTRIDPLTNLANRRRFAESLDVAMATSRRHQQPLSLISLDLDRFKTVNDTFGHDVGDHVLKSVAALLRESCRTEDLAVRLGGEEFLLLAPNTVVDEAYSVAERLRTQIANTPLLPRNGHLTCSFGVTQLLPQDTYFAFMKRADMALYEAKSGGRNKTVVRMTNDPKA